MFLSIRGESTRAGTARIASMAGSVKLNEVFLSIQGESTRAGLPCTLVRLAGCNLRCSWCDTRYALLDGREMRVDDVLAEAARLGCPRVEVTGGEPLLQAATPGLLARLCDAGHEVLLETNGSLPIHGLDGRVWCIVDVKCPGSGQAGRNCWDNLDAVAGRGEVKFVLAGRPDYEYAREVVRQHGLVGKCPVIFSPVTRGGPADAAAMTAAELAGWILEDRLDVRLGLQLHKIIWPGRERGV